MNLMKKQTLFQTKLLFIQDNHVNMEHNTKFLKLFWTYELLQCNKYSVTEQ